MAASYFPAQNPSSREKSSPRGNLALHARLTQASTSSASSARFAASAAFS